MRILVVFILLAFGLVTEGKTQRLNDAKTQSKDSATLRLCDSASYYESQIRKADSLYKNYLPQYNFEEVKAAMEFFDSYQQSAISGQRWRLFGKETDDENRLIAESRQLTAAKAHYYHAVGLTEKDDIVGACEHYLIALEIMEDLMTKDKRLRTKDKRLKAKGKKIVDNPEEYEKIRFIALIYNRLGRLFYNASYCDLAIIKYRKAIDYVNLINDNSFKANLLKELANSYQLTNKADSALCYYNKSLETNSNLTNKLDVEKSIVQILFYKGERDSAYRLINNNLDKLEGYAAKYSYYQILGEMYHSDNLYDSAIKYLNLSMCATNKHTILATSNILTTIYDSMGNMELKFFYDSISLSILNSNHNKSIHTAKLQNVYSEYANRKQVREIEKQKIESRKHFVKYLITALFFTIVLVCIIFVLRYRYRKDKVFYDEKIFNMNSEISEKNVEIENSKQEISGKEADIEKIKKTLKEKEAELKRLKNNLERNKSINIESYYNSEICKNISGRKESELTPLTNEELALLLEAADKNLGNISSRLCKQIPSLNKNDIYTICLIILNIEKNKFPYLLGRDRKTIYDRLNKIKTQMNLGPKQDLFIHIRDTYIN